MKKILGLVSSFTVLMAVSCNSMNAPLLEASILAPQLKVNIVYKVSTKTYSSAISYQQGSAVFRVQPGAPQMQVLGFEAQIVDEDNSTYTISTQGGLEEGASLPQGFVCPADKSTTGQETEDLYYCKPEDKAAKAITRTVDLQPSIVPDISKKLTNDCLSSLANQTPIDGVCPNLKIRVNFTVKNLSTGNTFVVKAFPEFTNLDVKGSLSVED